jgi:hypothetical protein
MCFLKKLFYLREDMTINIHTPSVIINNTSTCDLGEVLQKLNLIIQQNITMGQEFDNLKAKVEAQSGVLDTVGVAVGGIAQDVAFLKSKLADLSGGATAAQIADLSSLVDGTSAKLDAINTATATLDAETDPNAG